MAFVCFELNSWHCAQYWNLFSLCTMSICKVQYALFNQFICQYMTLMLHQLNYIRIIIRIRWSANLLPLTLLIPLPGLGGVMLVYPPPFPPGPGVVLVCHPLPSQTRCKVYLPPTFLLDAVQYQFTTPFLHRPSVLLV